jgi:hypothetical protein
MHQMGLSLVALGQGIPFFHAGDEMLRSKSLDRNSYNSGDWFNKLDFSYQSNNWGVGLPPAGDNSTHWPVMRALLVRPELKPTSLHITRTVAHFEEVLSIRKSSPLFRLRTAADIQQKVRFHNTGTSQQPGIIVMSITDEQAADGTTHAVIVFNAQDEQQTLALAEYEDRDMRLHPVLTHSTDPLVRQSAFNKATGEFSVPARTTAVFLNVPPVVEPPDAGPTEPDGGSTEPQPDGGSTEPQPDGGSTEPDGGVVEPQPDGGSTEPDGGVVEPQPDGGSTEPDGGSTEPDGGSTQPDAGTDPDQGGGGCGGCSGGGGESFSALLLLLGGILQTRRRRSRA